LLSKSFPAENLLEKKRRERAERKIEGRKSRRSSVDRRLFPAGAGKQGEKKVRKKGLGFFENALLMGRERRGKKRRFCMVQLFSARQFLTAQAGWGTMLLIISL